MEAEPNDTELEAGLVAKSDARWNALAVALADVEGGRDLGRWEGGDRVDTFETDGEERSVHSAPYVEYREHVERLLTAVSSVGAVQPSFDWMAWDGLERSRGGQGLEEAPVAESIRVITAIVRGDRFSEGTVLASLDDGTLLAAIRRVLTMSA